MLQVGTRVGDWRLLGLLGSGGMGQVHRATTVSGPRIEAALKLVPSAPAHGPDRFAREVEALAALRHPSIVRVLGWGTEPDLGMSWLAMEPIDGDTLGVVLRPGALGAAEARELVLGLGAGLIHAHSRGIAHRDLKPSNVLVRPDGSGCLIDFGIAHVAGRTRLTGSGEVAGTLDWMPPEVFHGHQPEPVLADVYGLGLLLHAALVGSVPRPAEVAGELGWLGRVAAFKRGLGALDPGPFVSSDLRQIVLRATAPNPTERFQDVASLHEALEAADIDLPPLPDTPTAPDTPIPPGLAPWVAPLVAAAVVCAMVAGLALASWPRPAQARMVEVVVPADPSGSRVLYLDDRPGRPGRRGPVFQVEVGSHVVEGRAGFGCAPPAEAEACPDGCVCGTWAVDVVAGEAPATIVLARASQLEVRALRVVFDGVADHARVRLDGRAAQLVDGGHVFPAVPPGPHLLSVADCRRWPERPCASVEVPISLGRGVGRHLHVLPGLAPLPLPVPVQVPVPPAVPQGVEERPRPEPAETAGAPAPTPVWSSRTTLSSVEVFEGRVEPSVVRSSLQRVEPRISRCLAPFVEAGLPVRMEAVLTLKTDKLQGIVDGSVSVVARRGSQRLEACLGVAARGMTLPPHHRRRGAARVRFVVEVVPSEVTGR